MIDLGTSNNNKINWAFNDKKEFIAIVEIIYIQELKEERC